MRFPALSAALPLAAVALSSIPARAQVFTNPAPITIGNVANARADPYPSTITVSGLTGNITDLNVQINGLRHTFTNDVDVMLVGPGGQAVVLFSDAGGTLATAGVNLVFDDEAATPIPMATQIVAGSFQPANHTPAETFPAPAPATPVAPPTLTLFDGTDPNGTWSLYVFDDTGLDVGRFDGPFALEITTDTTPVTTIAAATGVRIHDPFTIGVPNPSTITVSGAPISITSITVTLNDFSHLNPDDLDIVLVGPTGAHLLMWSDAGGTVDMVNANVTLDDAAATILPDATVIATGTFLPRNYGTGDTPVFPPLPPYVSAATGGTGTFTTVFANTNPNGVWSLYVTDDVASATGTGQVAGGWSLNIVATPVELMDFKIQ